SVLEMAEGVDGKAIERRLVVSLAEEPGVGCVPEILEKKEPGCLFRREDARDGEKGPDILLRRRRIHQDRPLAAPPQPLVAAERGVTGKRLALGRAPAGADEEILDKRGAVSHRRRE